MITPNELFKKRLRIEWKDYLNALKAVVDWIIAVYIIVPFAIIGIGQYLMWWQSAPAWTAVVPLNFFITLNMVFAWFGTIRLFTREADQLFLCSRKDWIRQINKQGIAYSVILNLLATLLFYLLLAPFYLVHYEIPYYLFALLFFITLGAKVALGGFLKQIIQLSYTGIKQSLLLKGTFTLFVFLAVLSANYLLTNPAVGFALVTALFALSCYLYSKRINLKGSFFEDLEREQKERAKYITFILQTSGIAPPKQKKRRSRPFLFRQSKHIFKERTTLNGLVEFCLKSTLRNSTHLMHYGQFVLFCTLIVISGSALSWLFWLGLAFILPSFVSLYWTGPMNSDFIKLFKWGVNDKYHASQKFIFITSLPGFILISITAGFQIYSWLGAIAILPASILLLFYTCKIISSFIFRGSAVSK